MVDAAKGYGVVCNGRDERRLRQRSMRIVIRNGSVSLGFAAQV